MRDIDDRSYFYNLFDPEDDMLEPYDLTDLGSIALILLKINLLVTLFSIKKAHNQIHVI